MRSLEGRALHGLDEFMLRLGHLKVLCSVAAEAGGSAYRFEREVINRLTHLVPVPSEMIPAVASYLWRKKLCPTDAERESSSFDPEKYRYREIVVSVGDEGCHLQLAPGESGPFQITWQDLCLASQGIQSRVGAVTVKGKKGSKTGLSHIIDWAIMLELMSPSGMLSAHGQLLANFSPTRAAPNPYVVGHERIVFGELVVRADFDVFSTLIDSLAVIDGPIRKKDATQLYVGAVRRLVDAAESDRSLPDRQRYNLLSLWRDIKRSGRDDEIVESTAWHRAASRFETYVDLGLLNKGVASEDERYEYTYYVSDALRQASKTLQASRGCEDWLAEHVVDVVLNTASSQSLLSPDEMLTLLPDILKALARPTAPLPLDALSSGLAWVAAELGQPISLGAARGSLENFAIQRPELARLATGVTSKAEYISIASSGQKG